MRSFALLLCSVVCIIFAFVLVWKTQDSMYRDITAGLSLLLAVLLAVPAQVKDAVVIVKPLLPWAKPDPVKATQEVAEAAQQVAVQAQQVAVDVKAAATEKKGE